jgi:hypothetical protein
MNASSSPSQAPTASVPQYLEDCRKRDRLISYEGPDRVSHLDIIAYTFERADGTRYVKRYQFISFMEDDAVPAEAES